MVNVIKRTRKLQQLLAIRNGPGAAVLPREVTRIHMDFSLKTNQGHQGAKKFWRNYLVRLKYHNPAIPMTVTRTEDATAPALMTLHFSSSPPPSSTSSTAPTTSSSSSTSSPESNPAAPTTTSVIDMKHLSESAILEQLLTLTQARAVRTSPEDTRLMQELEEYEARNDRVREMMAAVMVKRKREADILNQARGEVEALKVEE